MAIKPIVEMHSPWRNGNVLRSCKKAIFKTRVSKGDARKQWLGSWNSINDFMVGLEDACSRSKAFCSVLSRIFFCLQYSESRIFFRCEQGLKNSFPCETCVATINGFPEPYSGWKVSQVYRMLPYFFFNITVGKRKASEAFSTLWIQLPAQTLAMFLFPGIHPCVDV